MKKRIFLFSRIVILKPNSTDTFINSIYVVPVNKMTVVRTDNGSYLVSVALMVSCVFE